MQLLDRSGRKYDHPYPEVLESLLESLIPEEGSSGQFVFSKPDGEALKRRRLAAAKATQRMDIDGDVDHVTEIVRQVACEPLKILRAPSIVDVADDGLRLGHDSPPCTTEWRA